MGFTTPCPAKVVISIDGEVRSVVDVPCPPPLPPASPGQPRTIVTDGPDVREAPGFELPPGHHVIGVEFAGETAEHAVEAPVYLDDAQWLRTKGVHGPLAEWLLISISDLGIRITDLSSEPMTM